MTEEEIHQICKKYNIENYKINSNMSIDIDGNVDLHTNDLVGLPLKFGKVSGDFWCFHNKLTTLEGCPQHVGGEFCCYRNKLTTLDDLPINFYIGGDFACFENEQLTPVEFSRLFFGHIGGRIYTDNGVLAKFLNKNKNPHKKDLPRLLSELRKITL